MEGTVKKRTRNPEIIIREGMELGYSSAMIAQEVERHIIENLIETYARQKPVFQGLRHLSEFREFVENGSKE